jgi:hypothetical protein
MYAELTPTQREIMDRHRAFKAAIAARAVPPKPPAEPPSFGVKGDYKPSAKALDPQSVPSETDPPKLDPMVLQFTQKARNVEESIVWPVIPDEPVELDGRRPKVADIRRAVCKFYGRTEVELSSPRRTADLVYPRQVAMYLAKTLTVQSLPEIGRRFGMRDHTTVMHAVRKLSVRILKDENLAHEVALLIHVITGVQQ